MSTIRTVVIPFGFSCNPMQKLAIINFEKNPESEYKGLEPQYFDDNLYGKGYRVIAYRNDGYVDVYDDINLNHIENENFDVAGKGLCERKRITFEEATFKIDNGCLSLSFRFNDKLGRKIVTKVIEQTTKKTKGINLLAPIGASTENPSYLPLFFLYEFDFVRKHKTFIEVTIDGRNIKLDNFPVPAPKDFQWRYYSRYSPDCHMIEFAPSTNCILEECHLDSTGLVLRDSLEYQYINLALKKISFGNSRYPLAVEFEKGFPELRSLSPASEYNDNFKIFVDDKMGFITGEYSIKRESETAIIELIPSGGWTGVPNSFLTKMLFREKSVFYSWPKTYRYIQSVNIDTLESTSRWERIK